MLYEAQVRCYVSGSMNACVISALGVCITNCHIYMIDKLVKGCLVFTTSVELAVIHLFKSTSVRRIEIVSRIGVVIVDCHPITTIQLFSISHISSYGS